MNKIDFKEMVLDWFYDCPCPDENKKILDEFVEVEKTFLDTLNDEQKNMYIKLDSLKDELDFLTQNQIVGFVLSVLKSIFS